MNDYTTHNNLTFYNKHAEVYTNYNQYYVLQYLCNIDAAESPKSILYAHHMKIHKQEELIIIIIY
jgi:hypothetical protein